MVFGMQHGNLAQSYNQYRAYTHMAQIRTQYQLREDRPTDY